MSIRVMTLVWQKSRNARTALLLELAIADFAHDNGRGAWPSVPTLAQKTRMTERNVQLLLDKLIESHEIDVEEGGGPYGTNAYAINVKLLEALPDSDADGDIDAEEVDPTNGGGEKFSPPPREISPGGEKSRANHARNFTGGVKNRAQITREISPNPSLESSMNHPLEPSNNSNSTRAENEIVESELAAVAAAMDSFEQNDLHVKLVLERAGFRPPAPLNLVKKGVPLENALLWACWVNSELSDEFDKPHGFAVNQMTLDPLALPPLLTEIKREMLADAFRYRCVRDCEFCEREWEKVIDANLASENLTLAGYQKEQARLQAEDAWRASRVNDNAIETQRTAELERARIETVIPLGNGQNSTIGYLWRDALSELQMQMTKATFDMWVKPSFALDYCAERDELVIGVRNASAKQWLEMRLSGIVERTVKHVLGRSVRQIRVECVNRRGENLRRWNDESS